jgi:phospholipase C
MSSGLDNLKHIVVLMMVGRSFDHMLGFLKTPTYPINGLSGSESNLDDNNAPVQVTNDAIYFGDLTPGPGHSHFDVMQQMFDGADPAATPVPPMTGFVKDYRLRTNDVGKSHNIMKCFSKPKLPVLSTLAQQFCLCDNWFSSVPGPTFPNRAYAHAATSIGRVDMSPVGYVGISKTIYELLNENGVTARIYYNDTTLAATFPKLIAQMNQYYGTFQAFLDACGNNSLPAYSFIEPRYSTLALQDLSFNASDQHPDHDVHEGEKLIQQVFQATWNNPVVRNSTLLVITYDQHGGLYDHVRPPKSVNPDAKNWNGADNDPNPPFNFDWLGVRVPAVLVSPFIIPNTIDSTLYDHSSIISTARKVFLKNWEATYLTRRDKDANTYEDIFNLDTPRTDRIQFQSQQFVPGPLTEHQKALVQVTTSIESILPKEKQTGIDPDAIPTEGEAADYLARVMSQLTLTSDPSFTQKELDDLRMRKDRLDEFKNELNSRHDEAWWHIFFYDNKWIFGYGLNYVILRLEESKPNFGGARVDRGGAHLGDYLVSTSGKVRFTVLVEIKTPDTPLLSGTEEIRSGAWSLSRELTDSLVQIQSNVDRWNQQGSRLPENVDRLEDQDVYTVKPGGVIVIGALNEVKGDRHKWETFERFRRSIHEVQILTFDELYERARYIVHPGG